VNLLPRQTGSKNDQTKINVYFYHEPYKNKKIRLKEKIFYYHFDRLKHWVILPRRGKITQLSEGLF
jgi:hypothetical protein